MLSWPENGWHRSSFALLCGGEGGEVDATPRLLPNGCGGAGLIEKRQLARIGVRACAHWDRTQKFRSPHFASYKTMIGLSFGTPQHTPSRCQPRICPNFGDMAAYEWYFSTFITKYAKNHNFEMP